MHVARLSLVLGCLLAGQVALGCAGADASARSQFDGFRRDIDRIQSDNDKLNERLTNLEAAEASREAAKAPAPDAGSRPSLQVVRIGPDAGSGDDDNDLGANDQQARDGDEGARTVIRAEGNREPSVREGSAASGSKDQAERDYQDALALVKKKKYDDALTALAGYLVRYPSADDADNATYWRGECYYAKGDYVRAAEQFEGVVARFPNGNKVPDALLKLGLSQRAMGERDKARETFDRLRKSYPSSDAVKKIPRE